ncbi:MAG: transglycosylase SLT domain-containing protein [Anaerolineales bacterium]
MQYEFPRPEELHRAFPPSEDEQYDGEAAQNPGCLSVLLFPPFSAALFGSILLLGLSQVSFQSTPSPAHMLARLFTPQVLHWEPEILEWAHEHGLDPNLVATVMQIESCGDPLAESQAGALGLFQVMPYHFAVGENRFEPEANAARGLDYLNRSLAHFNNDAGMALAGYNGGIAGASRPQSEWAQETIDYMYWGENIYGDALAGKTVSAALEQWLAAGGASLCAQAAQRVAELH